MRKDLIDYSQLVEMIVFCPDWQEKERILKRAVKKLVELETIEQINNRLTENEEEYGTGD
jgi:mannitol/fructose-specific phosphotransferase system IIA component (Ntr-type)